MDIEVNKIGDISVVKINGRLDTTNYNELEAKLSALIEKKEVNILLDLEQLEYVSSSGLRIFLMFLKKIKAANGRFMLSGMSKDIMEIFEISGFVNIFEIFEDQESALKS